MTMDMYFYMDMEDIHMYMENFRVHAHVCFRVHVCIRVRFRVPVQVMFMSAMQISKDNFQEVDMDMTLTLTWT
jgi:hypothetical protein